VSVLSRVHIVARSLGVAFPLRPSLPVIALSTEHVITVATLNNVVKYFM